MKASEINPRSWYYGMNKPKTLALERKWKEIIKTARHMEETLFLLMNNPETTPEQLVLASKLYANVTKQLHDHAMMVDEFIYHGSTEKSSHMLSCPAHPRKTGNEEFCVCKDWSYE